MIALSLPYPFLAETCHLRVAVSNEPVADGATVHRTANARLIGDFGFAERSRYRVGRVNKMGVQMRWGGCNRLISGLPVEGKDNDAT